MMKETIAAAIGRWPQHMSAHVTRSQH